MHNRNYAEERDLPSFIIMEAHDGEGNPRPVRYINEEVIRNFKWGVEHELAKMDEYVLIGRKEE